MKAAPRWFALSLALAGGAALTAKQTRAGDPPAEGKSARTVTVKVEGLRPNR
jgi:hypothetical protein